MLHGESEAFIISSGFHNYKAVSFNNSRFPSHARCLVLIPYIIIVLDVPHLPKYMPNQHYV